MSNQQPSPRVQDEIDLRELFLTLWEKKSTLLASALAGLALSAIYAFLIAKPVYESSALLLPTQAPSVDQLGAAAALLGKKGAANADAELYQSLLTSRTVIHKLLDVPIRNESDSGKGRIEPLHRVLAIDIHKPPNLEIASAALSKSITVDSKESGAGGILEVRFTASSPWLAQQLGNSVLQVGQEELRIVRIERSNVILSRLGVAVNQARNEWDSTAHALTLYKDRNRSISLPDQLLDLSRLDVEKSAKEQKYMLARREYEMQLLEQAKAAPPMMILDAANLPTRKSKPKRLLILLLGCFASTAVSVIFVIIKNIMFESRINTAISLGKLK